MGDESTHERECPIFPTLSYAETNDANSCLQTSLEINVIKDT